MTHPQPSPTSETALAPMPAAPDVLAPFRDGSHPDYWTSLPLDTDQGKALVLAARLNKLPELREGVGRRVNLAHVLMHPAEKHDDKTGETIDLLRMVLIDADGSMHECYATGVSKALRVLFQTFGPPPWPKGLPLTVRQVKTSRGYLMLSLEYTPEPEHANGRKR